MVLLDVFSKGDVYLDYPYESVKFRYERETRKVFGRFYGQPEAEVPPSSELYHEAISAGKLITREEYYGE